MGSGWFSKMAFRTGYFYFVNPCRASIPVKPKFVICVSEENDLFYLINSCDEKRPYEHELEHVVYLEKINCSALDHRSYIDVSKPRVIEPGDYSSATAKGVAANDIWLKIKKTALSDRKLGSKFKKIIENSKK